MASYSSPSRLIPFGAKYGLVIHLPLHAFIYSVVFLDLALHRLEHVLVDALRDLLQERICQVQVRLLVVAEVAGLPGRLRHGLSYFTSLFPKLSGEFLLARFLVLNSLVALYLVKVDAPLAHVWVAGLVVNQVRDGRRAELLSRILLGGLIIFLCDCSAEQARDANPRQLHTLVIIVLVLFDELVAVGAF